ncbi:MAG: flavin reductase family protein [Acidimicrobiia bacterium]
MSRTLDDLCGDLSYPMVAVSASSDDGERDACLVGFSTQISIQPWRYLVGLSVRNRTFQLAQRCPVVAVHFLQTGDLDLARLLGSASERDADNGKSTRLETLWSEGPEGSALIDGCENWFVGRILARHPCGDHVAHVLEPVAQNVSSGPFEQLDGSAVMDLEPGQAP